MKYENILDCYESAVYFERDFASQHDYDVNEIDDLSEKVMKRIFDELKDDIECNVINIIRTEFHSDKNLDIVQSNFDVRCSIVDEISEDEIEKLINNTEINIQDVEYDVEKNETFFTAYVGRNLKAMLMKKRR